MKFNYFILVLFLISFCTLNAQTYTWTGDGDGVSLYQEANWKNNGTSPSQIDPNVPITYNLLITTGNVGGGGFNGALLLGGNTLSITGGRIKGNNEIASFSTSSSQKSTLNASGGLVECPQLKDLNITLENDANITLGDTTPIPGSSIDIDANYLGIITFTNANISQVRSNELSQITINGTAAIEDQNIFLTPSGNGTVLKLYSGNEEGTGNKDYNDSPIPNNGPNIIYIYLDDLGYGDLGNFWQNQRTGDKKMATPNLDKIANEGAMLTHHYTAAPVCAPARASLLEGLHQGHSDVRNNSFDKAMADGLNVAQLLAKSGYRTMHVGKAGLAGSRGADKFMDPQLLTAHPLKRGFDQFYGYLYHSQGHHHYPENGTTSKYSYFTDGYTMVLQGTELTYTTDVFTAKSKQWIQTHEATRPEQPFFLYLAYDVPHSILQAPTVAYPAGGGVNGGLQWTSANSPTPWVNTAYGTKDSYIHPDYAGKSWTTNEKKHATMIRRVDNAVEDLVQLLKDLNIDDETLIVFSTDNGPHSEGGQNPQSFQSYANMNGIKRDMWEAGIRTPTICRFPGTIPAGIEVDFPSGQWDWLATFAELAEVPIPAYTDGVSLMPSLKQDNINQVDKGYTYHEYNVSGSTPSYSDFEVSKRGRTRGQMQVIRMGDYKGVRYNIQSHSDDFEIYNVVTDERESINLASNMPELEQQMKDKVLQVRKRNPSYSRPYDNEFIPSITNLSSTNGLLKKVYSGYSEWVPKFEYQTEISNSIVSGIDLDSGGMDSNFGIYLDGYLDIPVDGTYTFYLQSASKTHIMLHEIHLLDNDFEYSSSEQSETLNLKAGMHPISIYYQQNDAVAPSLNLKLEGPGIPKAIIPNSMFCRDTTLSDTNDYATSSFNLNIDPQPIKDNLTGTLTSKIKVNYSAYVYSIGGQIIAEYPEKVYINPGTNQINISTNKLASGLYFLMLKTDNKTETIIKKFIKL